MSSAFNIPAGFALVPLEPTMEMLRAGFENREGPTPYEAYRPSEVAAIFRDMLSAAPTPPVDAVPGEPVATVTNIGMLRATPHGIKTLKAGDKLYAASVASRAGTEPVTADQAVAAPEASRQGEAMAVVEKAIAAALRQHGLTLLKNASGYEIDIWAPIVAQPQAGTPTQAEIDSGPHGGLGNVPADYTAAPTPQDSATPDRERAASLVASEDTERLDWLENEREGYGHENIQEGNRWSIDGPFKTLRDAIDESMKYDVARATSAGEAQS